MTRKFSQMKEKQILHKTQNHKQTETLWYRLDFAELKTKLATDFQHGLNHDEVERRRQAYGPNQLPDERTDSAWIIVLRQIKSPLVYILFFASVLSLILRHFSDMIIIMSIVVINVIVGFIQERRAGNTLAELKKVIKPTAKVIRNGQPHKIDSRQLVPGDLIMLAAGDRVPADARLVEAENLEIMEAELTGESVPALKHTKKIEEDRALADMDNMVFMGTEISFGKGHAVVVAIGNDTELGKIAEMLVSTDNELTPLQKSLAAFSKLLAWLTLGLAVLLMVVGLWRGLDFFEILVTSVAIAVAAIPEGLLISLTVILAVGMQRLLRKRGLVRHLAAAETLGSTSVIATDKTGTLTLGEMRVTSLISAQDELHIKKKLSEERRSEHLFDILKISLLANEAVVENSKDQISDWKVIGSPTDRALLIAAAEAGFTQEVLDTQYRVLSEIPFDERKKFAATLRQDKAGQQTFFIKGAAELILNSASSITLGGRRESTDHPATKKLLQKFEEMTKSGLRVLGVAYKDVSGKPSDSPVHEEIMKDLVFVGFVGLKDPVRQEVPETMRVATKAGLHPVIITGDHRFTTMSIAKEIGLKVTEDQVMEGNQIDQLDESGLLKKVEDIKIYSRVTPIHKLRIIDAWQKKGQVVAMTGDGVNDAPALKKADIGMSLGSGTEVAKQASDLVLLDNNFKTIIAAVEQGRIMFNNIRKVIVYLLSDSFAAAVLIGGSIILDLPIPLLPGMILWNNLISDGFPTLALTVEPGDEDVMLQKPRPRDEKLVNREMKILILAVGLITDLIFLGFYYKLSGIIELETLRTLIFIAFSFNSLIYVLAIKNLRRPIWRINIFSNKWLVFAIVGAIALQVATIYVPFLQSLLSTVVLPAALWVWIAGLSFIKLAAIEITKAFFRLTAN